MKRVSKKELDSSVSKIKTETKIQPKTGIVAGKACVSYIQEDGSTSDIENSKTAIKMIQDDAGTVTYYAKVNWYTRLFHPNNIFYLEESERRGHQQGTSPYRLIPVSKDCFLLYQKFLEKKNPVFLAAAQKALTP